MPVLKVKNNGVWEEIVCGNSGSAFVELDSTLSIEGAAADAKAVGDKFAEFAVENLVFTLEDGSTVTKAVYVK